MPWNSTDDLPEKLRKTLPSKTKAIFLNAFNSAWNGPCKDKAGERYPCAFQRAWGAVKNLYRQEGDKGSQKPPSTQSPPPSLSPPHKAPCSSPARLSKLIRKTSTTGVSQTGKPKKSKPACSAYRSKNAAVQVLFSIDIPATTTGTPKMRSVRSSQPIHMTAGSMPQQKSRTRQMTARSGPAPGRHAGVSLGGTSSWF